MERVRELWPGNGSGARFQGEEDPQTREEGAYAALLIDMHAHLAKREDLPEVGGEEMSSRWVKEIGGEGTEPRDTQDVSSEGTGLRDMQKASGKGTGTQTEKEVIGETDKPRRAAEEDCARMELDLRRTNGILTCFSAGTPGEWERLLPFRGQPELRLSFGVHPWYADQYTVEECLDCLKDCDLIGEIGMDSVWCGVPLDIQQKQLERQLQAAADQKKAVLLHTKGCEARIADIVKGFPGRICVHWYSGSLKDLEAFLKQDCYFTLGPDLAPILNTDLTLARGRSEELRADDRETLADADDLAKLRAGSGETRQKEELYRRMLREIPLERMFVETDGISAVAWARGEERLPLAEIPRVLRQSMETVSRARRIPLEALGARMRENLREFLRV